MNNIDNSMKIDPIHTFGMLAEEDETMKVTVGGNEYTMSVEQVRDLQAQITAKLIMHRQSGRKYYEQRISHMWPFLPDSKYKASDYPPPPPIISDYEEPKMGDSYGDEFFSLGHCKSQIQNMKKDRKKVMDK